MKDDSTSPGPPTAPGAGPGPGNVVDIPITEAELQKLKRHLAQQNQPNQPRATIKDTIETIKPEDFLRVHRTPCAREGFLAGIGGGAAVGGLRYILGAAVPRAANWAVGFGALFAIVRYEVCQASRRAEHNKVKRVVEIRDEKQAELRKQNEAKRRAAAQKAVEEEAAPKPQQSWYKFW